MAADSFLAIDFDPRGMPYTYNPRVPWPIPIDQDSSNPSAMHPTANAYLKRSTSPLEPIDPVYGQHLNAQAQQQHQHQPFIPQWPIPQPSAAHLAYSLDNTCQPQFAGDYNLQYHTSPTDFMSAHPQPDQPYQMGSPYLPVGGQMGNMSLGWQSFQDDFIGYPGTSGLADMTSLQTQNLADRSPSDTYLEVRSLTSSSSDGWVGVDYHHPYQSIDVFQDPQTSAISNPEQTLHLRTFSDSSHSDAEQQSQHSWTSSFVEVPNTIGSPGSDSFGEIEPYNIRAREVNRARPSPPAIVTSIPIPARPMPVKKSTSPQRSPVSTGRGSPPTRRQSRKNTSPKTTKSIIRRPAQPPKAVPEASEKRVGRRKGPLRPDQRKQASEIRKLGACLRCKFLKKTVSTAAWSWREGV